MLSEVEASERTSGNKISRVLKIIPAIRCVGELRGWGVVVMLSVVEASARKFVIVYVSLLEILHYVQDDRSPTVIYSP